MLEVLSIKNLLSNIFLFSSRSQIWDQMKRKTPNSCSEDERRDPLKYWWKTKISTRKKEALPSFYKWNKNININIKFSSKIKDFHFFWTEDWNFALPFIFRYLQKDSSSFNSADTDVKVKSNILSLSNEYTEWFWLINW